MKPIIVKKVKPVRHPVSPCFKDLTNQEHNRLKVIAYAGISKSGGSAWFCECSCEAGNIIIVRGAYITSGHTQSCGCFHKEQTSKARFLHGKSHSTEHNVYCAAQTRCKNKNNPDYHRWGGRGIKFKYKSFNEFYADVGPRPSSKHTLDRKDNNGHYEPGNCRWATQKQQTNNQSKNHLITYKGKTKTLAEWCGGTGTRKYKRNSARLCRGWCIPCALELPAQPGGQRGCTHQP